MTRKRESLIVIWRNKAISNQSSYHRKNYRNLIEMRGKIDSMGRVATASTMDKVYILTKVTHLYR